MSIRHIWHKHVSISALQGSSLLLNIQNIYVLFIITFVCLSVPHTVAYFDAAKFSLKLFSFIYFIVSIVRQRDGYKIVTEMQPIKTTLKALPSKMFQDLHKNPDL